MFPSFPGMRFVFTRPIRFGLILSHFCLGIPSEFLPIDFRVKIVNFPSSGFKLQTCFTTLEIHAVSHAVIQSVRQTDLQSQPICDVPRSADRQKAHQLTNELSFFARKRNRIFLALLVCVLDNLATSKSVT